MYICIFIFLMYAACIDAKIIVLGQGVVLDRSAYSDSVFARVCTNQGYISEQGTSACIFLSTEEFYMQ